MTSSEVGDTELLKVLAAADLATGDRAASLAWLDRPLAAFGGQTPEALVASGRTNDVIRYLDSFSSGFVG